MLTYHRRLDPVQRGNVASAEIQPHCRAGGVPHHCVHAVIVLRYRAAAADHETQKKRLAGGST